MNLQDGTTPDGPQNTVDNNLSAGHSACSDSQAITSGPWSGGMDTQVTQTYGTVDAEGDSDTDGCLVVGGDDLAQVRPRYFIP